MPTNPLWLEHTERAAWDTVQALRQQVEAERARVDQFARLQESWPKLLATLDALKTAHALTAERPHDLVEELGLALERARQQNEQLQRSAERSAPSVQSLVARSEPPAADATSEQPPLELEQFVRLFREHARAHGGKARSYERVLDALETKLDELEQASRRELPDHALELAQLAFELARSARGRP